MASYDAIVVGGGVVGASAAYALVREGARTRLLDRRDEGRATAAGAGILSGASGSDDVDPVARFQAQAAAFYPHMMTELEEDGAGETGYAVCGSLTVAVDADEAALLERARAHLAGWPGGAAAGYSVLSGTEARALFPPLGDVHGGLHCTRGARVDGRLLAAALLRAAGRRGLETREAEANALLLRDGAVRGVRAGGEDLAAGHVVLAAGAWSGVFGEQLGVRIPVRPQRGQIVHLDLRGAETGRWPIVSSFNSHHYMVAWEDSRVVVGATRESNAGFAPRTTVAGLMEVLGEALRVAPGLRDAGLREVRVGLRPLSADGLPILGPVPGVAGVLLATGHGPVGLQLGPYSGRCVAHLITRGRADADLAPFDLARFAR